MQGKTILQPADLQLTGFARLKQYIANFVLFSFLKYYLIQPHLEKIFKGNMD